MADGLARIPPQAIDAEQSVLGAIMVVPESFDRVADILAEADFYRRDHRLIFRAMVDQQTKGDPFDAVTLAGLFAGDEVSPEYLIQLAASVTSAAHVVSHAKMIRDRSAKRQVIDACASGMGSAFDSTDETAAEIAARTVASIESIGIETREAAIPSTIQQLNDWVDFMQAKEDGLILPGMPSPWAAYNELITGFGDDEFHVIAGRPGMAKSTVAKDIAYHIGANHGRVLVFSVEMSARQFVGRALAGFGSIPLSWIKDPKGHEDDYWPYVSEAMQRVKRCKVQIIESTAYNIQQIAAISQREHRREPLRCIVIDHLHIVRRNKHNSEEAAVAEISWGCKALAKRLHCPVIGLAQLNRGTETRVGKRPELRDLRGSGGIEQDADCVTFLHRDDYYAEIEGRASNHPGKLEMIVAKQRDGETGSCWTEFVGKYARVDETDYVPPIASETTKNKARGYGSF